MATQKQNNIKKFRSEFDARTYAARLTFDAHVHSSMPIKYDVVMGPDCKYAIARINEFGKFLNFVENAR